VPGRNRAKLEREALKRGLSNFRLRPYQPNKRLAETLSVADVHLVSLHPNIEGLIVPSKFYGIAAAGRPTIFIGSPLGEIARTIAHYRADTRFPPATGRCWLTASSSWRVIARCAPRWGAGTGGV
jgi:hypothetical protein